MILHYPLESRSFQSDSNQTRTTKYQLSCGVTSVHTKHHSCVNGTHIIIANCNQASCNLIELQKRKNTPYQLKTINIWKKFRVKQETLKSYQAGNLKILSETIQKERTMFPFSILFLFQPFPVSITIPYDPGENGTAWYGMCLMSKYFIDLEDSKSCE